MIVAFCFNISRFMKAFLNGNMFITPIKLIINFSLSFDVYNEKQLFVLTKRKKKLSWES